MATETFTRHCFHKSNKPDVVDNKYRVNKLLKLPNKHIMVNILPQNYSNRKTIIKACVNKTERKNNNKKLDFSTTILSAYKCIIIIEFWDKYV